MPKRVCAVVVLSGLLAAGSASAATSSHAKARAILAACLTPLRTVPIVKIASKKVAVHRLVKARFVANDCSVILPMDRLATAHPDDKAIQDAFQAALDLSSAVGHYVDYVAGVTFGRQKTSLLHRAQREVAAARREARAAYRELR